MPAPIDPKLKAQIKRAYVSSKLTPEELASKFNVSARSIQGWAKNEHWNAERTAEALVADNVVNIESARQPRPSRRFSASELNSIDVVNQAIADLYADLGGAMGKDKAALANALRGLLEYREKIEPPTVVDLVKRAIELGYTPETFMQALRSEWQRQKA